MKRRKYTETATGQLNPVTSWDCAKCSLRKVDTVQVLLEQMSQLYFGVESEVYFWSDCL